MKICVPFYRGTFANHQNSFPIPIFFSDVAVYTADPNPLAKLRQEKVAKSEFSLFLLQSRCVHRSALNKLFSFQKSTLKVSEELGIAQSVISGLWQRFQDDGNVSRCYSTGRSPVAPPNEDRYLAVTVERNRRSTAPICLVSSLQLPGAMGSELLYMDDNARPDRANIVDECLHLEDITRMDWPAYSPNLNPIEHVWDILGRRIAARQPPPTCLPQLRRALLDELCNISQDQIDNLILSMRRRYKACIASDEAHFWLNGYVNKQNCRIWSEANPQVYVETPLHPEKLTVWCALWAGGIIGPYFFKNDEGHKELWFQQDGTTCHTARATINLLKDTFGDRLISRFGPGNWPPRSCDLTPLDYFLWGYVKSLVYADKPQMLEHLEDNIRRVIADIRPQMLGKVIENWTSRLEYIRVSCGSPMPEIVFNM
ncbi:uncharacterized protein TNCV_952591 [Trichonephila clavipes]|nr:uncharacterized protein TNCV_952591 [Trichonephila clavipes]